MGPTIAETPVNAKADHISNGRLSLNVVSSWWEQEARMSGVDCEKHDDRNARTLEWLERIDQNLD